MSDASAFRSRAFFALAATFAWSAGCQKSDAPPTEHADASPPTSPVASSPELTGNWTVVSHHIPVVSALSSTEATEWHGRVLRLNVAQASSDDGQCEAPTYNSRSVGKDSLLGMDFQLPPGSLAPLDSLEQLTVLEVSCGAAPWVNFGGLLIKVDDNRALAPWDGVFFELARNPEFRALGQEPFWHLEIYGSKQILFVRLGETPVVTPVPAPHDEQKSGARRYHAITEANDLRLIIEPVPCTDTMSGQSFETTVTVTLNQQDYRGCGGPLK